MRIVFIIFVLSILFGCDNPKTITIHTSNDDFYEKCRKLVLCESQPGQEYFFRRKAQGTDEISIIYLGDIITVKKDTLRILNSVNFSGQLEDTKHGSGNVFIYDSRNKKIGFYYVGAAWGIPLKIQDGYLLFSYTNESCNQATSINLKDSIPSQIFINCKEKGGDLYSFAKE